MMMEAVKLSKSKLRLEIKQKLSSLSKEVKQRQSAFVADMLFSLPQFINSRRVSVYLSTKDEISTDPIVRKLFEMDKSCFVPRYTKNVMEMVRLESVEDFAALPLTKWAIRQPALDERREDALETGGLDLVIVPGVAFTASGDRLGHGGGYYDAYLARLLRSQTGAPPPQTVALAFKEQLLERVPKHAHDLAVDTVLYAPV